MILSAARRYEVEMEVILLHAAGVYEPCLMAGVVTRARER